MLFRNRSLGVDVTVECPDNADELDKLVGEQGASLKAALRYYLYHSWNGKFREKVAEKLQETTGIERPQATKGGVPQVNKVKDDDGNEVEVPVLVSEQAYVNLVLADGAITDADYAELAQEVADEIPFSPATSTRVKKPTTKHLDFADRYIAAVDNGEKTAEEFIQLFESKNPGHTFASLGEWGRESLATAIRINEERAIAEAKASALSL